MVCQQLDQLEWDFLQARAGTDIDYAILFISEIHDHRSHNGPAAASTHDASSRKGPRRLSSLRQQSQSLFVIHGLPRDKFLGKHIHSAQEGQLDEKLHKIQVPKDQGAGLSHLVANPLQMGRHLGPVQARSVVMTEVVSFVHEVHLIKDGHGICKIILGMFRVTEGVLNP